MARVTSLHPAQDLHLAKDIKRRPGLDRFLRANTAIPWYPFIDGGMGAISEIAAHVLVHALHQSGRGKADGSNVLPKRFKEVIAGLRWRGRRSARTWSPAR